MNINMFIPFLIQKAADIIIRNVHVLFYVPVCVHPKASAIKLRRSRIKRSMHYERYASYI